MGLEEPLVDRYPYPLTNVRISGITICVESLDQCMLLTALNGLAAVPLQFGGDLIGLAILFLILAVIAAVVGASGVAGVSMSIAKWLVIIFVVLAIITFIL